METTSNITDMRDSFSKTHPLVSFLFFAAAITFSFLLTQPVCVAIGLLCALANALYLNGKKAVSLSLKFLLPASLFIIFINPLVNHRGATVLCYLPWGNPLTLESLLYGFVSAAVIGSAALWFSSFNAVITSDKIIFLFGKISPALSLILAMALRFIPLFTMRFKETMRAQRQITQAATAGSKASRKLRARFKAVRGVFSAMIGWSMENAIETSDSMKSRGYGLKGRTAFSLYSFHMSDAATFSVIVFETAALCALLFGGQLKFRYFPSVKGELTGVFPVVFYCVYTLLLLTPLIINISEGIKWKRLRSKI